jgi:hypothetical protein
MPAHSPSQNPSSPSFWLRLQFDFERMRAELENGERIQREVQPCGVNHSMDINRQYLLVNAPTHDPVHST